MWGAGAFGNVGGAFGLRVGLQCVQAKIKGHRTLLIVLPLFSRPRISVGQTRSAKGLKRVKSMLFRVTDIRYKQQLEDEVKF